MHSFFTSAALVASVSVSLAAPANLQPRSTFEIKQVVGGKVLKNGPMQMVKTYKKFGVQPPAHVVAAAAAAQQTGSVTASPEQYDQSYLCPVTLGENTLNLDFDTGSADLYVYLIKIPAELETDKLAGGHTRVSPHPANRRATQSTM